jgi:hypothetical protein
VSPGGTGKSTTLLQLGEGLDADDGTIPLLIPLGEWSDRQEDFFASVLRRNAFGTFRRQHLMQLAYYGRLALLLDGWNELTPSARLRATNDIAALRRDFPQLSLVISSRREAIPVSGPVIEIDRLSENQQLELARAEFGEEGVALIDRAWRTPGVRELVGIPLYLNALLTLPAGAVFPETKEAVLRMFVQHNEMTPDKVERLQRDTFGQHTAMLVSLAVEANEAANSVISDSNANRTVSTVLQTLSNDGQIQIGATVQPRAIIDGLVGAHLLVRAPAADGAIRFQHQLFQEWYAAAEVERLMLAATAHDGAARKRLREDILNWPSWEESVLFACDRLSRAGDDCARAVAATIDDTLAIDPLFAAAMLDRASDAVWQQMRNRVVRFVRRWHTPGKIDRAVRFMITSGKPQFAELVWPLASNVDDQIQLEVFRLTDGFRPSVLGPEREARLRALPSSQRKIALSQIASQSGFDGMDLAATLASTDSEPSVVVAVLESLAYRHGDRHVNNIMQTASDAVWSTLARNDYPDYFTDRQLNARLVMERAAAHAAEAHPIRVLSRILEETPADAASRIEALLGTAAEDFADPFFEYTIAQAHLEYPSAIAAGLVLRIIADLTLPHRVADYLVAAPLIDAGPVADVALEPSTPKRRLNAAAAVIGPITAAKLFDQLATIDEQQQTLGYYETLLNGYHRLVAALTATRQEVFVRVALNKGQTNNPRHIGILSDLLARHGRNFGDEIPPFDATHRVGLRALVEGWMEALCLAPEPQRHAASEIARAAERLANADLAEPLRRLLERDLSDYDSARAARFAAGGGATKLNDMGYTMLYARAFAAMREPVAVAVLKRGLADLRWGIDAASALYEIWSADRSENEKRIFRGWADFSQHLAGKLQRAAGAPPSSDFAEGIFEVVRTLSDLARSDAEQRHAIALAATGLALPHGAKRREIDMLLGLPQPITHKHRLLVAAARAGEVIPVRFVMDGLHNLLDEARTATWRLDQNRGELMGWVVLFPFTESPDMVYEALALLPKQHRRPHSLHRLLTALPQGPAASAFAILTRLAADDPTFVREFGWIDALVKLDTDAAAFLVLDYLCAGHVPESYGLSRALAWWAQERATIRKEIIARFRALPPSNIRRVLERAMADLVDEDVFMALFDAHVDAQDPFHGVAAVLQNLAIGKKPSDERVGAFELFGRPLIGLRARLFSMLIAKNARSSLAKQCLIAIDQHRDEHGRVSDEPRHPDIATSLAWPPEADEPSSGSS